MCQRPDGILGIGGPGLIAFEPAAGDDLALMALQPIPKTGGVDHATFPGNFHQDGFQRWVSLGLSDRILGQFGFSPNVAPPRISRIFPNPSKPEPMRMPLSHGGEMGGNPTYPANPGNDAGARGYRPCNSLHNPAPFMSRTPNIRGHAPHQSRFPECRRQAHPYA